MIEVNNISVYGFAEAIRGMRNPMNSWNRSDSDYSSDCVIGEADLNLMQNLISAGSSDHRKFLRMITVYADINAPLYWWKEFDTYKVGTVANSCSTMHKIHTNKLDFEDFSTEHLDGYCERELERLIELLNIRIDDYNSSKNKKDWWQLIQMLPSSYNQKRTVQLNYEVLRNMYHSRKNHKLDEWRDFCKLITTLPYGEELIVFNN